MVGDKFHENKSKQANKIQLIILSQDLNLKNSIFDIENYVKVC